MDRAELAQQTRPPRMAEQAAGLPTSFVISRYSMHAGVAEWQTQGT